MSKMTYGRVRAVCISRVCVMAFRDSVFERAMMLAITTVAMLDRLARRRLAPCTADPPAGALVQRG